MSSSFCSLLGYSLAALSRFESGETLDSAIAGASSKKGEFRPALQAILYDLARHYYLCDALIQSLAQRAPTDSVRRTLMLALSEILVSPKKDYALVNETVRFVKSEKTLQKASGFVNACLRRFCREKDSLIESVRRDRCVRLNAPNWYIKKLDTSIGKENTDALLSLAQVPPRLILRVNRKKSSPQAYCETLANQGIAVTPLGEDGVLFKEALPVEEIPGFPEGVVSVQDTGAQLAARFLAPRDGELVLDACAAPGGKTCHLLEISNARVIAAEINPSRATLIEENLTRLNLEATVLNADASNPETFPKDMRFDAILLDAPCTASGIVRRHPDVPFLRKPEDIESLAKQQKNLLETLWPRLKFGGRLLYVVCSVFREEGKGQVSEFLRRHKDAHEKNLASGLPPSLTLLPRDLPAEPSDGLPRVHDGFFYALLIKE